MGELRKTGHRDLAPRPERTLPDGAERPLLALREVAREGEGSWEARFELALEAVAAERGPRQRKRRDGGDPLLQALALGLGPGQGVELTFRSHGARAGGQAAWSILGVARGGDSAEALASGEALRGTVSGTLASFDRSLRFRPTEAGAASGPPSPGEWRTDLLPGGVALRRPKQRRAGFVTGGTAATGAGAVALLSPAPGDGRANAGSAFGALLHLPDGVEGSVTLASVQLGPKDLGMLSSLYDWLTDGEPKALGLRAGDGVQVDDPETLDRLKKALEGWLRTGRGVRLGCRLASRAPVPPGLAALLGKELFPGGAFETRTVRGDRAGDCGGPLALAPGAALDLRGCLAASFPLPRVLPDGDALLRAGVPRDHGTSPGLLPATGVLLGRVGTGAGVAEVRFSAPERTRHAYLIGATGTGKSTLMLQMLVQDMEAGAGVCLIDPHGDLYQQALESVPAHRADDVVLLDASDFEHPAGINLLEIGTGPHREVQLNFAVNEMIRIFDRLYDLRQTGGPIFEQYMRSGLLLALDSTHSGATLMDVPWIFEDSGYRQFLKTNCKNPLIVSFWDKQAEQAGGEMALANMAPYITSKLNQFTSNALLRPIIGQSKSTVDFRQAMDRGRIVLVNLSKGLLGDLDSRLLGMLVIGKIFAAALGRAAVSAGEWRPFYLYIDEFQTVTTDTVAHILAEARKYGLHLTLANQNLGQIQTERGPSLQEALLGNVGTLISFRLGPADAEKLQSYTRPEIDALALQDLPNFHAAARLLADGAPLRPFVFRTLPPHPLTNRAKVRRLVGISHLRHARPRQAVEEAILKRRERHELG